jgi:hypothetical protein
MHAGPLHPSESTLRDGVRVTTLARTCVDLAREAPFDVAVAAIDECLRRKLTTTAILLSSLNEVAGSRGARAAERAIEFANAKSDSAGESWCRCRLFELGTPRPSQQERFEDHAGLIGFVDFWFESVGVVVEFDGDQKYLHPRYSKGRTPGEIVVDERKRERRLLALATVREVVRVEWRDLVDPWRLRALLVGAGVPVR